MAALQAEPMTDMMAARTRYFDDFFHDAARAGIRQGVILASGLDARGYRLHWADGTRLFEIDQPEVIEFKTATLAGLRALPTTDLRFVPIDLEEPMQMDLRTTSHIAFAEGDPGWGFAVLPFLDYMRNFIRFEIARPLDAYL